MKLHCGEQPDQATLELDYDPRLLTLTQLDQQISDAGLCLSPHRAEIVLPIQGMVSPRSEQAIETALGKLPGVVSSASFASRSLRVEFDRRHCALPEIVRRLDRFGFHVGKTAEVGAAATVTAPPGLMHKLWTEYFKLTLAFAGGACLLAAFLVHVLNGPQVVRIVLAASAFLLCGWYSFKETLQILRELRFDIDVLMVAAAFGAASLGHFEEGALLLFLFAIGGAGEELAMDKARRAIAALAKLAPETATVRLDDGTEKLVRVEELQREMTVVIKPFERIPADGVVSSGASAVDQAPITGESVPVEKTAGAPLFAGTINGEGLLLAKVTKLASETTLAKIVKMVNEAQTAKSPTQVFTDKVEKFYVPFVLIATAVLIVVPPLLGLHHRQTGPSAGRWAGWFYQAMAFLTAASPCALAIGTPAAVLSAIARAARIGVLVKGGVHLESLARVNAVAFDKTGTLTRGRPTITDVVALSGSDADVLALAASVEQSSTHPLAKAIVDEAQARQLKFAPAEEIEQIPGKGLRGRVAGRAVAVGHHSMLDHSAGREQVQAEIEKLAGQGKTTVLVIDDGRPVGVLALADNPRENARAALQALHAAGVAKTIMLTGDNAQVATAIAKQVGLDEFHAGLLPEDKVTRVRELQAKYGPVAMIGDGVNDAPALAAASVGIAMGASATDVALETADVALMSDDLAKLPAAIALARFARRIIAQNLIIALGVIAVLAPLSALGFTMLGIAVLFHEGSTVVVVLNSLRLLGFRGKP